MTEIAFHFVVIQTVIISEASLAEALNLSKCTIL